MPQQDYPRILEDISAGYQRAQVLFTALRAGVFERLRTPVTADELATQIMWNPRGVRMLLDALQSIGLVIKENQRYANSPVAESCLVSGSPNDQRHILLHKGNAYSQWGRLEDAVRTGEAPSRERLQRTHEELRAFICGMADIGRTSAQLLVDALDLAEHRPLLDIGAGPGTYAISLLEKYPHLHATLVDLAEVLPITREAVARAGLADRVDCLAGDLLSMSFPPGYDLALLSNIVHSYGPTANSDLIKRIHDGMEPGGRLIIKDFLVDAERSGPPFSLMFALHMLLHSDGGDTYKASEVADWTREAGFGEGLLLELTEQTKLWVVQK